MGHHWVRGCDGEEERAGVRTRKSREITPHAAHTYADGKGDKRFAVKVTDIFGNDGLKIIRKTV
jgi:hypothetical protein